MPEIRIILDGDGALADWQNRVQHNVSDSTPIRVVGMSGGMQSGKPSVLIGFELPDGSVATAQTSLRLFLSAADALKARHGDPREGEFGGGKTLPLS